MPRFLTLADVAEQLQISAAASYALVRSRELEAIQIGGRGQWRVEESKFEEYINRRYAATARLLEGGQAGPGAEDAPQDAATPAGHSTER
ncbi:helix-turn-helix domain-containing protein [Arthrobacter sp. 35W]|uniref:helix-turn-helix domain-containing protein n=1 Tax=Arthrobacter sp. 35W TaxID=1132441 RepID=UPI000405700A|nr:helix-turn-helix domain-containing protein [Arthrobacter sp. 35W]